MIVSPGALSSAIAIGKGIFPAIKSCDEAIDDHVYAIPP